MTSESSKTDKSVLERIYELVLSSASFDVINTVLRFSLIYTLTLSLSLSLRTRTGVLVFIFAMLGLIFERVLRNPIYWALIATYLAVNLLTVPVPFSGRFLNLYWTLAIVIALSLKKPLSILAINARLLTGLLFLQAFAWKAFTLDFVSGAFMRCSLQFCSVFREPARKVGLVDQETFDQNMAMWDAMAKADGQVEAVFVSEPGVLTATAIIITVWTIFIEGTCAASFLSPSSWKLAKLRHPAILLFMWTVYLLIPVWVFAGLFCAMGLILTRRRDRMWRLAYVFTFFGMMFLEYGLDVPTVIERILQRL